MDLKCAFKHPMCPCIWIFIGGDMPHLLKKIVSSFDRSGTVSSTDLKFRGKSISLVMLRRIWDCDQNREGDLRTNILTLDHF